MTEKMTYVKAIEYALTHADLPTEVADKLTALRESIAKKNAAERKPTTKQKENAAYKQDILDFMVEGHIYTAAEIAKSVPSIVEGGISVNRVSPMLTQMAESGLLTKTVEKRKNYYSLA